MWKFNLIITKDVQKASHENFTHKLIDQEQVDVYFVFPWVRDKQSVWHHMLQNQLSLDFLCTAH